MRPFKNNHKRRNRGPHDRPFKRSNDINRLNTDFYRTKENLIDRNNFEGNIPDECCMFFPVKTCL